MIALQADVFLPSAYASWFAGAAQRPLLNWVTLGQGVWLTVLAIAVAAVAVSKLVARDESTSASLTFLLTLCALVVIALLRPWPTFLATTEALHANVLLVLLAPTAMLWVSATALGVTHALSHYATQTDTVARVAASQQSGPSPIAAQTAQNVPTAQLPSAAQELGLADELSNEQMREVLANGYNHLMAGDLAKASLHARATLDYDENHPDAHNLLALVAMREGRIGVALRAVLRAIEVFPEHALYHLTVSDIYGMQNRFHEQAFALQEASRLDPANVGTKTRLLLAKRKAMMQDAQRTQGAGASTEHRQYELIVSKNIERAKGDAK
jgi:tetratricopeptide (TPR) repeat protein